MTFRWNIQYYPTRLEYQAALRPFAVPSWIKGITLHHTIHPTAAEWRGRRSMEVLGRFYQAKGWSAGPHLFVAPDGIWGGSPLSHPGVHAGPCNADRIGIEICGNFDNVGWDLGLRERIYALVVELLHWAGLDETAVNGHRDCKSPKTCPGTAINMAMVRRHVRERLFDQRFIVTSNGALVRRGSYATAPIVRGAPRGLDVSAYPVLGKPHKGNAHWAHIKLPSGETGYIWAAMGRFEPV